MHDLAALVIASTGHAQLVEQRVHLGRDTVHEMELRLHPIHFRGHGAQLSRVGFRVERKSHHCQIAALGGSQLVEHGADFRQHHRAGGGAGGIDGGD